MSNSRPPQFSGRRSPWQGHPAEQLPASVLRYSPTIIRYQRCWNEYWTAWAAWKRFEGIWFCCYVDAELQFLIGLDQVSAKMELIRRGCSWEWTEIKPENIRLTVKQPVTEPALDSSSKAPVPLEKNPMLQTKGPDRSSDNPHHPPAQGIPSPHSV